MAAGGQPPNWKGLFEWSMQHHDGTMPSTFEGRVLTEADRKWFTEAMAYYMKDVVERMREIKGGLDKPDDSEGAVEEKEKLLDELVEIVENIDHARDLTKIGGLQTLLALLQNPHPSLRSRAAEVAATCVQSNPPVQDWFMQGGALPKLLELYEDRDPTCRTKALLALSCLLRHNAAGLDAFRQGGGFTQLVAALEDEEPRVQRKALQLMGHLLQERLGDAAEACRLGLPHALCNLVDHDQNEMRHAALEVANQLAKDPATLKLLKEETALKDHLRHAEATFRSSDVEDLDAVKEEVELCQHLLDVLSQPPPAAAAAAVSEPGSGIGDRYWRQARGLAGDIASPRRAAGMQVALVPNGEGGNGQASAGNVAA
ncbi:hypothetical protein WJX72_009154 [[Myrmecia] bisecta]|uniref:Nucleotide exchange factor Fes1 domain-containing protein n=1 Tax=[Myrmecia] bisecta TaxID=41462 RepID=A0AAW1R8N9_9CHLO